MNFLLIFIFLSLLAFSITGLTSLFKNVFNGSSVPVKNNKIILNGRYNSLTINGNEIFNNKNPNDGANSIAQSSAGYKLEIKQGDVNICLFKDMIIVFNGKKNY